MSRDFKIPTLIFIVIIVSVVTITILMNDKPSDVNPNLNQETSNIELITDEAKMNKIYVDINNEKLEINLEDNSTVSALIELLPLDITMNDLNSNEKYVYLDKSLPTNTYNPEHIEAGDVMLFGDNCLVIFYETFDTSYSYSKIGHIDNLPKLGSGSISIRLSTE